MKPITAKVMTATFVDHERRKVTLEAHVFENNLVYIPSFSFFDNPLDIDGAGDFVLVNLSHSDKTIIYTSTKLEQDWQEYGSNPEKEQLIVNLIKQLIEY